MNYKKCDVCSGLAPQDQLETVTIEMQKHKACEIAPITGSKPSLAYVPTATPLATVPNSNSMPDYFAEEMAKIKTDA